MSRRNVFLKTSTEDHITVYRDASIKITLGHTETTTNVLVADIMDKFIMDLSL